MSEEITRVIVRSQNRRDVALDGVIHLEENIADLEGKLVSTDGECVTFDYVAHKLQMFDTKFSEHHYKLVDFIDCSRLVRNLGRWIYVVIAQLAGNCQWWIRIGIWKLMSTWSADNIHNMFQTVNNNTVGRFQSDDAQSLQFESTLSQVTKVIDSTHWRRWLGLDLIGTCQETTAE